MNPSVVYLNGAWRSREEAAVSVDDRGMLQGVGLFETMVARNGRVWRLGRHLARMRRSAAALSLALPEDFDALPDVADELLARCALQDAKVRLTITAGAPGRGETQRNRPTSLLTAAPFEPYPAVLYDRGMTVLVTSFQQSADDPVAGHKTLSYLPRLVALQVAQAADCQEAIWFTPDRLVAEGCMTSIFIVAGGKLQTPPLDTPVLPGITREAVLELAPGAAVEPVEQPLTIHDLLDADEMFLTNVGLGVMPVCRIERHSIGDEQPGPVTQHLRSALTELIERETHVEGAE